MQFQRSRRSAMMMLGLLVLVVAFAGCGGSSASESISTANVVDQFKRSTGDLLIRDDLAGSDYDRLDFGNDSTAMLEKYGAFAIYVIKKDSGKQIATLLEPKRTDDMSSTVATEPDFRDIIWERVKAKEGSVLADGPSHGINYVAHKRYGTNVLLSWYGSGSSSGKDVDDKWKSLNSVLTGLAEKSVS